MDTRWYKLASAVLGALIGSACGDDVETNNGGGAGSGATAGTGGTGLTAGTGGTGLAAEYGMPMAHYEISGTVVAENGGQPIQGIEVTLDETMDTVSTDANGDFTISADSFAFCSADPCDANLTATDVDGAAGGGEFETTNVAISMQQTEPGSGTWDDGTYEAQDVDVSMADAASGGGGAGGGSGGAGGA
jgi:putative lipoprotein (rSAM/lipoprotein system)